MKYRVTYEYRGRVTVVVKAEDAAAAEKKGQPEADEAIHHNLALYDSTVREVEPVQNEPFRGTGCGDPDCEICV